MNQLIRICPMEEEASNAEITGPKFTAVFDSRGGLSVAREHGVQK